MYDVQFALIVLVAITCILVVYAVMGNGLIHEYFPNLYKSQSFYAQPAGSAQPATVRAGYGAYFAPRASAVTKQMTASPHPTTRPAPPSYLNLGRSPLMTTPTISTGPGSYRPPVRG